ncbi:MAG TPA: TolC family protein, partial [Polyangia bacterium]|nr:TolC family protein [Polyangia bacterium]
MRTALAILLPAILLPAISWSARASAAEGVPVMALDEALLYARAHQPQIRSALAEWSARKSEARIPRALWLPQIGATAQLFVATANNTTGTYLNVPEVDLPRIGATAARSGGSWSPSAASVGALSIDQELYEFGRIAAQIAAGDALAAAARASADAMLLDVQLGVEEAYHSVLAAKDVLAATEEALKRALTHRDFAAAGTRTGMRPPIDLTRAQADVAQLEVRRIRAQSGLESARAAFAASMGSTSLEVDAQPMSPDDTPSPALDEALREAARLNPAIARALAEVEAQHRQTQAIGRELLPNLFLSAGLSGRAGGAQPSGGAAAVPFGDGWLPDVANWHLGVIIQWNLFDATVLARRSASKAREQAAQANLDEARMAVTLGAERAYLELDAALKALPGLQLAVDAARANQAQADARFRAGLGTIVELADSEALLTGAELELAIGRF